MPNQKKYGLKTLKNSMTILVVSLVILSTASIADTLSQNETAPKTDQSDNFSFEHVIQSSVLAQDRRISIALPDSYYEQPNARYPVLYILDGENNMRFTKASVSFLSSGGQIPELIVVGVHAGATRGADYALPTTPQKESGATATDKNSPFLDFIDTELLSYIDNTYRTSDFRAISGHSLGGLFVTYTMTQTPELFDGYLAQSPAFGRTVKDLIVQRINGLMAGNSTFDFGFSMTLGDEPALEPGFNAVEAALQESAPDSFRWTATRQVGRSHMQTRLIGIYEALEQSFASDWPLKQAVASGDIQAHFKMLRNKYGPVFYDEEAFSQATQALLQSRDVAGGITMANAFLNQYPQSIVPRFLLINAYAMNGNRKRAVSEIDLALTIIETTENPTPEMQQLGPRLRQMRGQLNK